MAGATVIESPVCTPMGSRFSIEHTMTTLSRRSRMTSSSNSFHPSTLRSIRVVWSGDSSSARSTSRSEEHTSELQSLAYLVCRLLLEKKKSTTLLHHPHN